MHDKLKEFVRNRFSEMRALPSTYSRTLEELEGQLYLLVEVYALEWMRPEALRSVYCSWKEKTYSRCPNSWSYLHYLRDASPKNVAWDNIWEDAATPTVRQERQYAWYSEALVDHYVLFLDYIDVGFMLGDLNTLQCK